MNDIETINLVDLLADPLADTPEGWWEFRQILKWAHEKGWVWTAEPYIGGNHQVDVFGDDEHISYGFVRCRRCGR